MKRKAGFWIALAVVFVLAGVGGGCGKSSSGGTKGCQEACADTSECRSGYECRQTASGNMCLPTACGQCQGQGCAMTEVDANKNCSFVACQ